MKPKTAPNLIDRRRALGLAASGAGLLAMQNGVAEAASSSPGQRSAAQAIDTPTAAVANTKYGQVRGSVRGGIFTFKGIPYGDDTAGANRWLPPKPPKPWTGVRSALTYGPVSPHPVRADWGNDEAEWIYDWDDGFEREDMLRVNVWTSKIGPGSKMPVMVWIHGGGFTSGSCQELPCYDGENLARRGVVLVSLNHRLNALGFLDLSQVGGEAYRDSANVGLLDLQAALQWVRDNIANFGGDPSRVMIFGQSGGGSKVTCLMAMKGAAGLFHRAAIQSGGGGNYPDKAAQQKFAAQIMVELGLGPNDIAGLQKVDHQKLLAAGAAASLKINGPGAGPLPGAAGAPRAGFGPSVDGRILTEVPFREAAPEVSAHVPLISGSVRDEATDVSKPMTDEQARQVLATRLGVAKGDRVFAALKATYPNAPPGLLTYTANAWNGRNNQLRIAGLKAAQAAKGGAPVYQFWFVWQPTTLEGRAGAFHTLDLAFCFDNTKRCDQATGNTPAAQALAKTMSQAWINFAATGNPSQPALPWAPFDATKINSMVFDVKSGVQNDPASTVRKAIIS